MAVELGLGYLSIVPETSKLVPAIREALGDADAPVEQQSQGWGSKILSGIKTGIAAAGGLAAAFVVGKAFYSGIERVLNIEDARAKLVGLGHDAKTVDQIMANALGSVKGTAFGLDAAATTAAAAVAAGVKPGQDLERTLSLVADAATIAGTDMGSMGDIFNKVAASGKVQGDVINQLSSQGIPILQMLADELGVTAEEAANLASQGAISFDDFRNAMESGLGGAALAAGDTTRGAFSNLGAALSRFGAEIVEPMLPTVRDLVDRFTGLADSATEKVGPAIEGIGQAFEDLKGWLDDNETAVKVVAGVLGTVMAPALIRVGVQATAAGLKQVAAWAMSAAGAVKAGVTYVLSSWKVVASWVRQGAAAIASGAQTVAVWAMYKAEAIKGAAVTVAQGARTAAAWVAMKAKALASGAQMALAWMIGIIKPAATATVAMVATVAKQIAQWVLLGVQSLIQAAKVAASWLIAMGPIAIVIAAVVGLVALIIANWDKIKEVTSKVWNAIVGWLKNAWNSIKTTATNVWNAVVSFITGVPSKIFNGLASLGSNLKTKISTWFGNAKTAATDKFNALITWIKEVPTKIANGLSAIGTSVASKVGGWVNSIKTAATDKFNAMVTWVKGIPTKITNALGNVKNLLYNAGKNIIQGFLDGLKNMWNSVTSWVGGIGDWIANNKGPRAYDLALLRPAGRWIMQGLQTGLKSEVDNLGRTLDGVSAVIAGHDFSGSATFASTATPASASAYTGAGVTQNIYPQQGMSEEAIGDAAARRLTFAMTG